MLRNPKNLLILGYIIFLIGGGFYIRNVLKNGNFNLTQKDNTKKDVFELKPTKVVLNVFNNVTTKSYNIRLENQDSVLDLLNTLRKKDDLFYEQTNYTDKIVIDDVYKQKTPSGFVWKVYKGSEDITNKIGDIYLADNDVYDLKLVKTN